MVTEHPYEGHREGRDDDLGADWVCPGGDAGRRGDQGVSEGRGAGDDRGARDVRHRHGIQDDHDAQHTQDGQDTEDGRDIEDGQETQDDRRAEEVWRARDGQEIPNADGRDGGCAPAGGGAPQADEDGGDECRLAPSTDWERLGRTRPVPFALFDEETGERLRGRAERAEWNAVCDGGRPPAPEPVDPSVVPALPEEMLKALGWREVVAPRWDADEDEIREFLGPAPTEQEAREVAECFGWDTDDDGDGGVGDAGEGGVDGGLSEAGRLAQADPDPLPRGWPRPANPDLPVGLARRTDGEVADVGAHARRPADWQALHDLEHLDVPGTDPYTLVEAVAAWKRQEALAGYHVRMLAFELAHRQQHLSGPPAFERAAQVTNPVAAVEVAFRLGVTRQRARRLIDAGTAMATGTGILVGIALQQGEIDAPKADLIIERTGHLPMDLAMNVHDQVLPTAGLRTYPQVERDLAKAIAEVDPEDFSERHRHARTGRGVSAPRALPDGMAAMRLVTTAADAMALHQALEAAARTAKHNGDTRTLDQLRADALTTVAHSALATGHLGPCTPECTHTRPAGQPTGPDSTDTAPGDASDGPGSTGAASPSPGTSEGGRTGDEAASPAEETSDPGTAHATKSTPAPADTTGATPHTGNDAEAGTPTDPGTGTGGTGAAGGAGAAFGLGVVGGAKAHIHITVPLSTLMGTSNQAADLEGYGPIPAEVARAYAAGGIWRRLVTDPLTDRVIEATARRYEPPGWLREIVIANDPYCTAPGCNTAARLADLDHGIPFPHGPTTEENLHPLCRHHHGLKTEGHLDYTSPEPGVHEWTTPSGHRYRTTTHSTHLVPPLGEVGDTPGTYDANPVNGARAGPTRAGPTGASPGHWGAQPSEDDPPPF